MMRGCIGEEEDLDLVPLPIKQEILDSDDDELEEAGLIKPAIENILSTSDSEESVSGFEDNDSQSQTHPTQQCGLPGTSDNNPGYIPSSLLFPDAGETGTRKKREAFTLQQKLEVLKFLETHSVNATSRFYKVDPKSIRLWRSQKDKIEETVKAELQALAEAGEENVEVTPRKRIAGAGRKKRDKMVVEISENPNKRHRRTIKLSDKVEIIRLIEGGQTQSDVARSLGISQSTVQTIWSNKHDILERNSLPKSKRKNLHWKKYSSIDSALFTWYQGCRESGLSIDRRMLLDKALELAEHYKQGEFKSQANRWVEMFRRRHNVSEIERFYQPSSSSSSTVSQNQNHGHSQSTLSMQQHAQVNTQPPQITNSTQGHPGQNHPLQNSITGIFPQQNLNLALTHNQPQHQHQISPGVSSQVVSSSTQSSMQSSAPLTSSHHDLVPDFDLSTLPSIMAGLYPTTNSNSNVACSATGAGSNNNNLLAPANSNNCPHNNNGSNNNHGGTAPLPNSNSSQLPVPEFNHHLPVVSSLPVTTCDAMKYVEMVRHWIADTFGETEETLNNHLNAIENAVLKRRMTEMLSLNMQTHNQR